MRLTVLSGFCFALGGCLFPTAFSDHQQFIAQYVQDNPAIATHNLPVEGFNLHYRSIGTPRVAVAVWVHGTPGDWTNIGRLMLDEDFTNQVLLVSIDRPGWGKSQYLEHSRAVPTFSEQSRLISPLIETLHSTYPEQPLILVGHSWGASLVPTIAHERAGDIAGLLALAGPFDASLAAPRWYNRAASMGLIKHMIGEDLRRSNLEMYALPLELEQAALIWPTLDVPIIIVAGQDDTLVPVAHLEYAKGVFKEGSATFVTLEDQGHLLQMERTPLIGHCILALANRDVSQCRDRAQVQK